jgi:hypothetical protein
MNLIVVLFYKNIIFQINFIFYAKVSQHFLLDKRTCSRSDGLRLFFLSYLGGGYANDVGPFGYCRSDRVQEKERAGRFLI